VWKKRRRTRRIGDWFSWQKIIQNIRRRTIDPVDRVTLTFMRSFRVPIVCRLYTSSFGYVATR
jgi:hypothetical protein